MQVQGFSISGITGTMAAGLTSGSPVFAARYSASAVIAAYVTRLRLQYTTIAAYTTPVTAGRRLAIHRGSAAATTGGTALVPVLRRAGAPASGFSSGAGGDCRIATTAALGGSPTWEADPILTIPLTHVGAAGNWCECVDLIDLATVGPIRLAPGELLGIRAGATFDAVGTWQLAVGVDGFER